MFRQELLGPKLYCEFSHFVESLYIMSSGIYLKPGRLHSSVLGQRRPHFHVLNSSKSIIFFLSSDFLSHSLEGNAHFRDMTKKGTIRLILKNPSQCYPITCELIQRPLERLSLSQWKYSLVPEVASPLLNSVSNKGRPHMPRSLPVASMGELVAATSAATSAASTGGVAAATQVVTAVTQVAVTAAAVVYGAYLSDGILRRSADASQSQSMWRIFNWMLVFVLLK